MNRESLKALLIKHEGLRLKPYVDTRGNATIGVGRNLADVGISPQEANYLLDNDLSRVVAQCRLEFPWFNALCDTRQNVISSMVFNLGIKKFKGFVNLLEAIKMKDFETAANEMLMSAWSAQVGARALELTNMMQNGDPYPLEQSND